MNCKTINYSRHAFERMFERAITPEVVEKIIAQGEVIANYLDDSPYPSALVLGFDQNRPIHLVLAQNQETGACYVVTVYVPDPSLWSESFKQRRTP